MRRNRGGVVQIEYLYVRVDRCLSGQKKGSGKRRNSRGKRREKKGKRDEDGKKKIGILQGLIFFSISISLIPSFRVLLLLRPLSPPSLDVSSPE